MNTPGDQNRNDQERRKAVARVASGDGQTGSSSSEKQSAPMSFRTDRTPIYEGDQVKEGPEENKPGQEERDEEEACASIREPDDWYVPIDYCYLTEEERQEYRGHLEAATARLVEGPGGCRAGYALRQLALDGLVRHAYKRSYWDQIEIGGPQSRKGPGWLRHQEAAIGLASSSAIAFRRDLHTLVRQDDQTISRASMLVTMDWWLSARQAGKAMSLDDLIDYGTNQLAVVLMCGNLNRIAVQSNLDWWTVLAHRVVTRLVEPELRPFFPQGLLTDKNSENLDTSELAQYRVAYYIQYILKTFQSSTTPFEYKDPQQTISFLRRMCLNCEREMQRKWKEEEERRREEEKSWAELPQKTTISHADTLSLIAQYVENDLQYCAAQETQEGETAQKLAVAQKALTPLQEKQAYFKWKTWNVMEKVLGRDRAIQYWLLTLLNSDGFTWDQIVELFEENDCPIRYEDNLPPGVTWSEMDPAEWKIKKNAGNLRKIFSKARPTIYAELVKNNAAFPSISHA